MSSMRARYSRIQMSDLSFKRPEMKREDDPVWWDKWHADIDARIAANNAKKPEHWPASRQLALLMIQRSHMALDCIAHIKGVRATADDFAYLRREQLAWKRDIRDRQHMLTAEGKRIARDVCFIVAKQLGLHHITYVMDSWSEHRARCTCGWHASVNRRNNNGARKHLEALALEHINNPDAWKRAGEASRKVIADLFPRRAINPDAIDIDDCANVYGDGQAWPQIDTPCTSPKAPTGQCEFGNDPAICIHCGRKT